MPEAIVRIINHVRVNGEVKKRTADLELPASREQIDQVFRELQVRVGRKGRIDDIMWQGRTNYALNPLRADIRLIRIYELNHLMERIAALDDLGRAKLSVLCSVYLDGASYRKTSSPEYEPTIANAINLTHNLENIKVIERVYYHRELAWYCIEHKVAGCEDYYGVDLVQLDRDQIEQIGIDCRKRLNGLFSFGNIFVYNLPRPDEMIYPYDGKSLPKEPEPTQRQQPEPEASGPRMHQSM